MLRHYSLYSDASSGVRRDLFLALHADDPASGLAHGAGPGCAPSGNSSYKDTACETRSVRGLGMKNRKQFAHRVDMWDDDGRWSLGEGN